MPEISPHPKIGTLLPLIDTTPAPINTSLSPLGNKGDTDKPETFTDRDGSADGRDDAAADREKPDGDRDEAAVDRDEAAAGWGNAAIDQHNPAAGRDDPDADLHEAAAGWGNAAID